MFHLIPAPLHRLALRIAYRLRARLRKSTGTTRDGVSVIVRDLGGQLLLVRHSYGPEGWFFIGGGIDRGETAEQAARRELREEVGCEARAIRPIGTIEEELSGAAHTAHIFAAVIDDLPKPDGREIVEARFFPTHSLPEPLSPRTHERLALWRANAA
ncbi:NUDIX domain-containing protein [Qipengyuania seohaensis]|uniref:NUDIX domain-containing protein n=1 Tax=Qipengyuania seohaensis TaxID=266951 RepID=UPI000C22D2C7|nr:NUDIX domain-containing protein [Qipengyuania seohaensis]